MKIIHHEFVPEDLLLLWLKRVRLRGFDKPLIYQNANLRVLSDVDPHILAPPQRYVLKGTVQSIVDLAHAFEELRVDIFSLRGAVRFWLEGSDPIKDPPIPFLPPIVEESFEPDGKKVGLINDGMHRVYAAKKLGRNINIVFATSIPPEYPYYAYAIPEGWAVVEEIEDLTEGFKKKEYRNPENYKALFREFNEVFPGVQAQRKQTQSWLKE